MSNLNESQFGEQGLTGHEHLIGKKVKFSANMSSGYQTYKGTLLGIEPHPEGRGHIGIFNITHKEIYGTDTKLDTPKQIRIHMSRIYRIEPHGNRRSKEEAASDLDSLKQRLNNRDALYGTRVPDDVKRSDLKKLEEMGHITTSIEGGSEVRAWNRNVPTRTLTYKLTRCQQCDKPTIDGHTHG